MTPLSDKQIESAIHVLKTLSETCAERGRTADAYSYAEHYNEADKYAAMASSLTTELRVRQNSRKTKKPAVTGFSRP